MTAHNQEGLRPDAISSESSEQRESKQRKPGFDLKYRLMALLAGVGANFLPTGEVSAATTIDQQINDQRAGHTIKMNAADTEAFLAAPTVTPQATPTPAPVAMVDTAPKKSGGEKQPTATPISPEQTKVVQVVDVAGGINKRETPNGKILGTTAGSSTQITTFERTTESEKTVGGHTWIQLTDGEEIFWVASDIAGVNQRTETVSIGIGGGGNSEQDTLTQKQLLAEAQAQLGGTVADVREVNGVYVAFNTNDNEVGRFANGAWVSSLPQTSDEAIQRQTVLPAGSETETITGTEVMSETMTYAEFSQEYPAIAEKITDKMAYVGIVKNGDSETSTLTYINGKTLPIRVREDGIFEILSVDGKVLFMYVHGENQDPKLNGWAKPELESEKGLLKLLVSVDYHDKSQDRLLPEKATNHLVDIVPANPAIIDQDPILSTIFNMENKPSFEHMQKFGLIDTDEQPGVLENPLKKMDDFMMEFFKLLGANGELPDSMPIKLADGTETVFNPQLGVTFMINGVPSKEHQWLKGPEATISPYPAEVYTVDSSGRLVVYITTNYGLNSWTANGFMEGGLAYVLHKNGIAYDEELTAIEESKLGIPTYRELHRALMQYVVIEDQTYALPLYLIGQTLTIGEQVNYSSLKAK